MADSLNSLPDLLSIFISVMTEPDVSLEPDQPEEKGLVNSLKCENIEKEKLNSELRAAIDEMTENKRIKNRNNESNQNLLAASKLNPSKKIIAEFSRMIRKMKRSLKKQLFTLTDDLYLPIAFKTLSS